MTEKDGTNWLVFGDSEEAVRKLIREDRYLDVESIGCIVEVKGAVIEAV